MSEKHSPLVVLISCGELQEAEKVARQLVDEQLAACVNIVPNIKSTYRWQGKVCQDAECLLVCKTTDAVFPALEKRVNQIHSYEVPEIIALPIVAGSEAYLSWLAKQVT